MINTSRILGLVTQIYKPKYILLNVVIALVYYFVLAYLIKYQNYGVLLFLNVPIYLIYALILTTSILLTISIYSIRNTIRNNAKVSGTALSTITTVGEGIVMGCGCSASLLYNLTVFGLSASETFAISDAITYFAFEITLVLIAINIIATIYYLNKLSDPSCRIKKKG